MQPRSWSSICVLVLCGLSLWRSGRLAAAAQTEIRDLPPHTPVTRELAGGAEHRYRIALARQQFIRLQFTKQAANLTLSWRDPAGATRFTVNLEANEHGVEALALLAQADGAHTLIVTTDYAKAPRGHYTVEVTELRAASAADEQRAAAQMYLIEAAQSFKEGSAPALQAMLPKLKAALPLWQTLGDRDGEARTLFWLGWTHFWLNQYDESLAPLQQALTLREAVTDAQGVAEVRRTLGLSYAGKSDYARALALLQQAAAPQRQAGERWQLGFTLTEIGKVYWRLGDQEQSDQFFAEGLQYFQAAGDEESVAAARTSLGFIYMTQGSYQAAYDNLQQALPFFRAQKNLYGETSALNNLGSVTYNLGLPRQAREQYLAALAGYRALQHRQGEGMALINLGITEGTLGNPQQGLAYYTEALALIRAQANPRGEANLLRHMGNAHLALGNHAAAREHLQQALRLARTQGERRVETNALTSLGQVHAAQGDWAQAEESLALALPIHRAMRDRAGEAQTLAALAHVARARGALPQAQTQLEDTLRIIETLRAKVTGSELRATFLATHQGYYEQTIDLLMERHAQAPAEGYAARALETGERARARALLDALIEARANIRAGGDATLLARERELQKQLDAREERRLRLLAGKPAPEQSAAAEAEVEALRGELLQVRTAIRTSSPRYAALTQPQPLAVSELQAQLDADTLLLFYQLGAARSFLWAVTKNEVRSHVLPPRAAIESVTRRATFLLAQSHQRKLRLPTRAATAQLAPMLLGPVAGQLTRQRLAIVADGALHALPFAALTAPGRAQPLIAAHEIIHLPSVSALAQLRQELSARQPAPKTLAVIADPVYEANDPRFPVRAQPAAAPILRDPRIADLPGFTRLPHSAREAAQIARLVPREQQTTLLGFDASRAALAQTDLSQYRVLHFAAHSLLHPTAPELSGIALSRYDRAGHAREGFLRALDIYNLKLNADLVVLSACETALGEEVRGEGLLSLARGFMYAGAPRLVVSLWPVNDVATAELMQRFYRGLWQDKLRPAAALHAAQASMAREPRWSAPYYWAGFVLQGEWR